MQGDDLIVKKSILIKIKGKLSKNYMGKIIIKGYHYFIAIPLAKVYSIKFHFIKRKLKTISFFSIDQTFELLTQEKKSLSRFGDGEIAWIYKDSKGYFGQENSQQLSDRLMEVITSNNTQVIVGVPDFFGTMEGYSRKRIESRNTHLAKYYKRWMHLLEEEKIYADSLVTRVYNGRNVGKSTIIFEKWKSVWEDKDVLLIEGSKTRFGVNNDLMENVRSIKRIIAPAENAFEKYSEILTSVRKYLSEDCIVLISLGPTATIMSYDIGVQGYQAIDIGHLDVEYEWYLLNSNKKDHLVGKYVNESGGAPSIEFSNEILEKYNSEIIEFIS